MLATLTFSDNIPHPPELLSFNRLAQRVRLVTAFALLFLTLGIRYATEAMVTTPALVCAAGALLLEVIIQRLLARQTRHLAPGTAILFLADLTIVTFLVNFSGGLGSMFLFGYFAIIVAAGLVFAADGAYGAATLATLATGMLTLGKYFHIPPVLALFAFERAFMADAGLLFLTLTVICFLFYLAALFTARIAQILQTAREHELRALRQAAAEQRLAATGRLAAGLAHEL
ncbi:MAG TPA: hypothetical protein PKM88_06465, partial [bacterium]|nr:hypothetical protein [bacterium]